MKLNLFDSEHYFRWYLKACLTSIILHVDEISKTSARLICSFIVCLPTCKLPHFDFFSRTSGSSQFQSNLIKNHAKIQVCVNEGHVFLHTNSVGVSYFKKKYLVSMMFFLQQMCIDG